MLKAVNKLLILFMIYSGSVWAGQGLTYDIHAELEPKRRSITGDITIYYKNNSSDTLQEIWMHLWPNAYSSHQTAWAKQMVKIGMLDFNYGRSQGRIDSLSFKINDQPVSLITSEESPDIGILVLEKPLLPGQEIVIQTPFKVKLPFTYSRSGYDGSFYAVAQWYPKPAVYREHQWHAMPYLEQGEFFSEFARYNVNITVPSAYMLAASGHTFTDPGTPDPAVDKQTYKITLDSVHDFAWFAMKDFASRQEKIKLDSGKEIVLQVLGKTDGVTDQAFEYAAFTLKYMSKYLGEYPYSVCTVVQGPAGMGNGMEYTTICTVSGDVLREETIHEVIHNWWYGILANNERQTPWLDESMTSYYERRVIEAFSESKKAEQSAEDGPAPAIARIFGYNRLPAQGIEKNIVLNQQRLNRQQPVGSASEELSFMNYYAMLYVKGALTIRNLEEYLGRERFDQAMQAFYKKYAFSHIDPVLLQRSLESTLQENLDWFFGGVIDKATIPDIAIRKVMRTGNEWKVLLQNKSEFAVPVQLAQTGKDLQVRSTHVAAPFTGLKEVVLPVEDGSEILVADPEWLISETCRKNNYYKLNKGLPKLEPVKFHFLAAVEDPSRTQVFYSPVLGGNKYDGVMLGLALYNRIFPSKQLEYELVPVFAFRSKQFNWIGNLNYHIQPKTQSPIDIRVGLHSKSFSFNDRPILQKFIKLQPHIEVTFNKAKDDTGPIHKVGYRNVQIWSDAYAAFRDSLTLETSFLKVKNKYNIHELWYNLEYQHALYPSSLTTRMQFDKDFLKQSVAFSQKFRYTEKGAYVHIRLFAGAFYYRNPEVSFRSGSVLGFNLSGISGRNDYLYDHTYFGRSEQTKFASQQLAMGEGNFKVITLLQNPQEGKTVNGLMAVNFKIDAPVKWLPVQFFADFGYSIDKVLSPDNFLPVKQFHYDLGLSISLLNEAVEVYFPLAMSENFRTYYKANLPKFGQRITFMIDMNKLNIHKRLRSLPLEKYGK